MNIVQIYRDVIKFYARHKIILSPAHKRYLKQARRELVRLYPTKQDQEMLDPCSDLILALFLLDLETLRPQLQALYAPKPRGSRPRDPIQMFRSLLCMILALALSCAWSQRLSRTMPPEVALPTRRSPSLQALPVLLFGLWPRLLHQARG